MAVENKWVDANVAAGKKGNPGIIGPGETFSLAQTFEIAAANDDGSIFKLGIVGANMIPLRILWNNDAIAGATSYDLGFYTEAGVEVDKNILMAAHDINAGAVLGSEIDAMHDMGLENVGKKVYELLGKTLTTKENAYVLAITANTIGSAAGTISVRASFIQG